MALTSQVCIWQNHLFFYFAGLPRSLLSTRFPLSPPLASELNQNHGSPIRLHCGVPFSVVNVKPTGITRYSAHALNPWRRLAHGSKGARYGRDFQTSLDGPASCLARQLLCPPPTRYNNRYFALHLGACSQLRIASLPGSPTSESSTQQRLPSYRYL